MVAVGRACGYDSGVLAGLGCHAASVTYCYCSDFSPKERKALSELVRYERW